MSNAAPWASTAGKIDNYGTDELNISIEKPSPIRLVVNSGALPGGWNPPPATAEAGDAVVPVFWSGHQYWAVPPNVNGDAYPTPSGYYTGLATSWHAETIQKGSSYFAPLEDDPRYLPEKRPKQDGDLVFQVPLDANGAVPVIGLAYVSTADPMVIINLVPFEYWPKPSDPSSF